MQHTALKHLTIAAGLALAGAAALLWSWNTLADLYGGPEAGFKHAVAAMLIAVIVRGLFTRPRYPRATRADGDTTRSVSPRWHGK